MDTSNPLGPAPARDVRRVPGDGIILAGVKTYIVAALAAAYALVLAWVHSHTPSAESFFVEYQDTILTLLGAGAIAFARAAIAKVQDYLRHVHTGESR